jgi:hypothetical protein
VIGALGDADESSPMRARYMVKWALRTGETRWHVCVLFLWRERGGRDVLREVGGGGEGGGLSAVVASRALGGRSEGP